MTPTATIAWAASGAEPDTRVRASLAVSIARSGDSPAGSLTVEDAAWPHRIRRVVRANLKQWGQPDLSASAELLTTELLTNAFQHGTAPTVTVRLFLTDSLLCIEVADGSPNRPVARDAAPDDEDGRGLLLVGAIADAWGVSQDGTTTWCSLSLVKDG